MAIASDIKNLLTIKQKTRHDAYTDQFCRVFLVRLMMVATLVIGMNWYNDDINCIIPAVNQFSSSFTKQACWINGLYVFEDIRYHSNEMGYYGIPRILDNTGLRKDTGEPCPVYQKQGTKRNSGCEPMTKTFFLQYQYMVFFVGVLAGLFYAPHVLFNFVNTDIISLKNTVKEKDVHAICSSYFNYKINPKRKLQRKIALNLVVKVLYVLANVCAFLFTDGVLHGNFLTYGSEWLTWSKLPNNVSLDYMGARGSPKPANVLLPSFAMCEVFETSSHEIVTRINSHKFVCEMSGHILYQYMLLVMWFAMICGLAISSLGLVVQIVDHVTTLLIFMSVSTHAKEIYKRVTLRECEYLEFIRRKNLPLYGKVIKRLSEERELAKDLLPAVEMQKNFRNQISKTD